MYNTSMCTCTLKPGMQNRKKVGYFPNIEIQFYHF